MTARVLTRIDAPPGAPRCPDCARPVKRPRETCTRCGAPLTFKAYKARADRAADRGLGLRPPAAFPQEAPLTHDERAEG